LLTHVGSTTGCDLLWGIDVLPLSREGQSASECFSIVLQKQRLNSQILILSTGFLRSYLPLDARSLSWDLH